MQIPSINFFFKNDFFKEKMIFSDEINELFRWLFTIKSQFKHSITSSSVLF